MASTCHTCGAALVADSSAAGLCPACLFGLVIDEPGLAEDVGVGSTALEPGSRFGPFDIRSVLGFGGMSTVYEAAEPALGRVVALKILPPEFLHDDTFARRFQQEARVVAALEHMHIVPLYASGIEDGVPWMSMRLLAGGNLGTLISRRQLRVEQIIAILKDVAAALDYAHARGIVHRDVKPSNILLDEDSRVCVSDFGLARLMEKGAVHTRAGVIVGTPHYMAPETGSGAKTDRRTDVYSLGVVAYEMLTGHPPFDAPSPIAILLKHASEPMPMPVSGQVPHAVATILKKALAKEPNDRWCGAGAFVEALEAAAAAPVGFRPSMRGLAAAATVVVVGALTAMVNFRQPTSPAGTDPGAAAVRTLTDDSVRDRPETTPGPPQGSRAGTPATPPAGSSGPIRSMSLPQTVTQPERRLIAPVEQPPSLVETSVPPAVPQEPPAAAQAVAPSPSSRPDATQHQSSAAASAGLSSAAPLEQVEPPVRVKFVIPVYPQMARAAQLEGDVVVQATVDPNGRVTDVRILRTAHRLLDPAALTAVRQYEYRPGRRNSTPSTFFVQETVAFKLK